MGDPPTTPCPRCGHANPAEASFCMHCGLRIGTTAVTREVRKTVTAVFCDLVGSTSLGERHDPEVLRPLLHAYFQAMREAIERHGGRVEKFIGDAVVGIFGLPVAHEDDALRAVRAAMEMRERLAGVDQGTSLALECRIGVTTGEVLVPTGDEPLIGDTMNTAARLQANAEPGWILIGEPTFHLVREAVTTERVDDIALKGKARPVRAWRVHLVAPLSAIRARPHAVPMVGRDREARLLDQAYGRVVSDRSSLLVTVLGAAGSGKSRLIEEFLASPLVEEAVVLRGRCLPYGEAITYWPLAAIVRRMTGIDDTDTAEEALDRLRRFASGLPEGAAIGRGLAGIVGLEGGVAKDELVWALRRSLEHVSEARPAVVVIEDVHWAEPTLIDVVEAVIVLARRSPILVLCEARPDLLEDRPGWGDEHVAKTTIELAPLAEERTLDLIESLAAGRRLSRDLRMQITAAAEGNPLYVREFIGMLLDDGAVDPTGSISTWDVPSLAVPPTIHALLEARLDRLSPEERRVAERASVIGRTFDRAAVLALFADDAGSVARAGLDALARKALIDPDPAAPGRGRFRFGHQLIRDAAYERLPKTERAVLHEVLAGWLDRTAGDRQPEIAEILGYHLEQAFRYREQLGTIDDHARSIARRAADRLASAGHRAFERSDISAAVTLLDRAASLLEPADPQRLALLPELARALDSNGRFDDARDRFAEAVERSRAAGDGLSLAYARVLQCLVFEREVTLEERHRVADECFEVFEREGDDRGLALCWRLRGAASWRAGRGVGDEAALGRALEHARRAGAHREEVLIADGLSASFALGPTPVSDAIRRCLTIRAEAPGDRGIEMAMSHALTHLYARLGRFDLARSLALRCREIAAESGQRAEAAHLTEVVWDVETLAGDHAAAETVIAEGCAAFQAMGKPHRMLEAFLALSQVALGREVDVERLRRMAAGEHQATRALLEHAIATALLRAGELEDAEQTARSALDYFATTDLITMEADTTLRLGDVLAARGRNDAAADSFRRAEDLYRRKGTLVGVAAAADRLATLRPEPGG